MGAAKLQWGLSRQHDATQRLRTFHQYNRRAIGRRRRHPRRDRHCQAHGRAVDAAGGAEPGARRSRGYFAGDDAGVRLCRSGFSDRTLFSPLDCRQFTTGALCQNRQRDGVHGPASRQPGHDARFAAGGRQ